MKIFSYYNTLASVLQCDCQRLLKDKCALSYPVAHSSSSCFIILRTKKVQHIQLSPEFPMTVHQTVKFSFAEGHFYGSFQLFIQCKSSVIRFKTNLGQENVFSMIKSLQWVVLRNRTHTWSVLSSIILSKTTGLPWRRLPAVWCTVATVCQRFFMIV